MRWFAQLSLLAWIHFRRPFWQLTGLGSLCYLWMPDDQVRHPCFFHVRHCAITCIG